MSVPEAHQQNGNNNSKEVLRNFALPDKDTFDFLFVKSKFGFLRVAQFIFTLISWALAVHFKHNIDDYDANVMALFLFATITSWIYSILGLFVSFIIMRKRKHDLVRRLMIISCSLACSIFCLVGSSLLADYVRRLINDGNAFCDAVKICNELKGSVVFGYFAVVCFVIDAGYELYILNRIKGSNANSKQLKSNGNRRCDQKPGRRAHLSWSDDWGGRS